MLSIRPKANKVRQFKEWLDVHGAQVQASTNPYELVRFLTRKGTSIIYMNSHDIVTAMLGESQKAWDAFCEGRRWDGGLKTPREYRQGKKYDDMRRAIVDRDGWTCAYCGKVLTQETATIEHVLPLSRGGLDAIKNMVLACRSCNQEAGSLNIRKKIELAIRKRNECMNAKETCVERENELYYII